MCFFLKKGHSFAWGLGYPDLVADCPQMDPIAVNFWHSAFDPTKDYTYDFINNFMGEMNDIFTEF